MALQSLRINGFRMIGDLQRFLLYLYMNVSNDCHSAKTTGQLPVTNGFTMIADDGMTLSSRL